MARRTKAELEVENTLLREDMKTLEKLLNVAAEDYDLCTEYEEVLDDLNKELKSGFQFDPPGTEHAIQLTLLASVPVTVKVIGRNAGRAQDRLGDMTDRELFALAGLAEIYDTLLTSGWHMETAI